MHPEKTKIVYCKDSNRKDDYPHTKFDFLGYGFQPRSSRTRAGKKFVSFTPAISDKAKQSIREKVRACELLYRSDVELSEIVKELNPKLRGWINHYGRYCRSKLMQALNIVNVRLAIWAKRKYKKLHRSLREAMDWLSNVRKGKPKLFAHW
jgi:RNA-directed DNA polymerase